MKKDFEDNYHKVETEHWWFKSRRSYIINYLKKFPRDINVLDIGCSSGILLKELNRIGFPKKNLYGIDISESAIKNCKSNGLENCYVMDAQNIRLKEKFDVIIASDCLEHLEDDHKALENWNELLNENGVLMVFVPAFMSLWSNHDVVNMHFRRYTNKELRKKLQSHHFGITKSSYWNFLLFLPVFAYRMLSNIIGENDKNETGDLAMPNSWVNSLLTNLILFENRLLSFLRFPFGVSTFCIAKNASTAKMENEVS